MKRQWQLCSGAVDNGTKKTIKRLRRGCNASTGWATASQCSDASVTAAVAVQQVAAATATANCDKRKSKIFKSRTINCEQTQQHKHSDAVRNQQHCSTVVVMSATAVAIAKWRVRRLRTRHGHRRQHPIPYPRHTPTEMASIRVDRLYWRLVDAIESNDAMRGNRASGPAGFCTVARWVL